MLLFVLFSLSSKSFKNLPIPKKSSINANMDATLVGNFCAIALKLAVKKAAFPHPSKILKIHFLLKNREKKINSVISIYVIEMGINKCEKVFFLVCFR